MSETPKAAAGWVARADGATGSELRGPDECVYAVVCEARIGPRWIAHLGGVLPDVGRWLNEAEAREAAGAALELLAMKREQEAERKLKEAAAIRAALGEGAADTPPCAFCEPNGSAKSALAMALAALQEAAAFAGSIDKSLLGAQEARDAEIVEQNASQALRWLRRAIAEAEEPQAGAAAESEGAG